MAEHRRQIEKDVCYLDNNLELRVYSGLWETFFGSEVC